MSDSEQEQNQIEDWLIKNIFCKNILSGKKRRRKKDSQDPPINFFEDTPWGRLINHPNINDVNSYEGRIFRRRFRVPFAVFNKILVPRCKEFNIFQSKKKCIIKLFYFLVFNLMHFCII